MSTANNQLIKSILDSGLMSQNELAKELGISESAIYAWMRGTTKVPNVVVKYLTLAFSNLEDKLYQKSLDMLRISIKKLVKEKPSAESDIKDIVSEVFSKK